MGDEYMIDMLIAEDIMNFLYSESSITKNKQGNSDFAFRTFANGRMMMKLWYEEVGFPDYVETVGLAVKNTIDLYRNCINEIYAEFLEVGIKNGTEFASHALNSSPLFFPEGYNNGRFLGYCAMVMGVALCYRKNNILRSACGIVAQVLYSHQMTCQFSQKGAWLGLYSTSQTFNECIGISDDSS